MILWYPSSNRDETRYRDPDRFDVLRNPERQAFGAGGRHSCLGTALARLELTTLIEETLKRYPKMVIDGEPTYVVSNFANQLKTLPVRLHGCPTSRPPRASPDSDACSSACCPRRERRASSVICGGFPRVRSSGCCPWSSIRRQGGTSTGCLVIHVQGSGGGYWAVDVTSTGATVRRADAAGLEAADCTLECDRDAWHRLATGEITGMRGFMDGDVRLAGNFGLALRLDACFA